MNRDECFLRPEGLRNRTFTRSMLRNKFEATRNVAIAFRTVKRLLNEAELDNRRSVTAFLPNQMNKVARLYFT